MMSSGSGITYCIQVEEFPQLGIRKITPSPALSAVVTTYKDGNDILSYFSSDVEFCTYDVDPYAIYTCISIEQDMLYKAAKAEAERIIEENVIEL